MKIQPGHRQPWFFLLFWNYLLFPHNTFSISPNLSTPNCVVRGESKYIKQTSKQCQRVYLSIHNDTRQIHRFPMKFVFGENAE
jgi:hypothetical protein